MFQHFRDGGLVRGGVTQMEHPKGNEDDLRGILHNVIPNQPLYVFQEDRIDPTQDGLGGCRSGRPNRHMCPYCCFMNMFGMMRGIYQQGKDY